MYFSTIATVLAATAGLASAATIQARGNTAPATLPAQGNFIWRLTNFKGHRPKGTYYDSVSFEVYSTTENKLLFTCSHSDAGPMDERTYFCDMGVNDMTFSLNRDHGAGRDFGGIALLGHPLSDKDISLIGSSYIPQVCKLTGQGDLDFACTGTADAYINMVKFI
ncbi:hypothetical protein CFE70_007922 [Pyrenophora teres f. teres 0-1]|uniref:AA1-like domain-containing protein n=2 Tax=Pyrenophora teres f. teres TaxID=97479 RepID=E3RP56_PYRTT|nr:hypothetical protein PTT_10388 [Pyrenophora teres f. teres 0-1]KAE8828647.1 hypothetical protein PTNB85_07835 [Pyrenophora teres f. teres]KAE8829806.1 hypothetical protein HRS9139_06430 [Pyrenophora teres f. teres]KAE8841853.1 hypothetical protein HRS9122_05979 [Pyrenophora teres f. teres]KAE8859955.1 hypothetical protein PTNB29_07186 [Pyrenophora teres f. teres]